LIWFDQLAVYGSVNYHVQQMFAANLGSHILKSELDFEEAENIVSLKGRIGLATWQTSAAFDNLRIVSNDDGTVLYENNFNDPTAFRNDFTNHEGEWEVADSRLIQSYLGDPYDINTGDAVYAGDTSWSNYTLTVEAEILGGREGFLIPVCVNGTGNTIFWNLGGWGNTVSCLQIVSGNSKSGQISGTIRNLKLNKNEVYEIKIVVDGNNITCYLNDELYIDYTKESPRLIYETASIDENGDIIIKLVNTSADTVPVDIRLLNIDSNLYSGMVATILKGDDLTDMNSFDEPNKITPVIELLDFADEFIYHAPGLSVNIIRLV
jgi:alpha-L-arabinofuranosidase